MLKVGIIDSGANLSGFDICNDKITGVHFYKDVDGILRSNDNIADRLGHGTACLSAILLNNTDVHFYVVKIFNEGWTSDQDILLAAVRSCIEQEVDIMNVSLGIQSEQISESLLDICHEAYKRNIMIVAAGRLDDKICFPACHPEVIGVGCLDMSAPVELVYLENASVSFYTKGELIINGQPYFGTSFACAKITSELLQLMKNLTGYKVSGLKAALIDKAYHARPAYPFKLQYSVGFPDQAIQHLIRNKYFESSKKFSFAEKVLVLPLDDPDMNAIYASKSEVNGHLQYLYWSHTYYSNQIPALLPPDSLLNDFDTIALGKLCSLLTIYNYRPVSQQLKLLLIKEKHFIVYDALDYDLLNTLKEETNSSSRIIFSHLNKECLADFNQFSYFPVLKTPVLAMIGAGPEELISLQMRTYRWFVELDYDVAYVAPVMQGELLGAAFSYPVQHAELLHDSATESEVFLQQMLRAVQSYFKPDFILTGLPDSVIVSAADNKKRSLTASLEFLKGIQPDAFVVVVFEDCPIEEIMNNYYTATGITGTRRCCFLLMGGNDNYRLRHLCDLLIPIGIVIFSEDEECACELEKAVRFFFNTN